MSEDDLESLIHHMDFSRTLLRDGGLGVLIEAVEGVNMKLLLYVTFRYIKRPRKYLLPVLIIHL